MALPYERRIIRRDGEVWPRADRFYAWAQHRLDMTAAVAWFKSTQGGVYSSPLTDGYQHVLGLYISGFPGARAYMDAEIIITSLNGEQGTTPTSDETSRRYKAMRNNVAEKRLVGVIVARGTTERGRRIGAKSARDREAPLLPCNNMPIDGEYRRHDCWIAGFFLPTLVWPEKLANDRGFVWMVRLEKFDLNQQSWWANPSHGLPPRDDQRNFAYRIQQEVCGTCNQASPRIFDEMFLCTNENCPNVWQYNGQVVALHEQLAYTDDFLLARTSRPLEGFSYPLSQSELVEDFNTWWNAKYLGPINRQEPLTRHNYQERMGDLLHGFRCPNCSMLGPRIRWWEWHCRNTHCGGGGTGRFYKPGAPPTTSLAQITTFGSPQAIDMNDIISQPGYQGSYNTGAFTAHEFYLGEDCNLAYLAPNPGTSEMQGSSDDLYNQVQALAASGAIPLKRRWMRTPAGQTLTSHFSINYGEQYLYSARVPTISFDDAPQIVRDAHVLVNSWTAPWRVKTGDQPANELYLAGYFSGQKMNYHDDGETGLGDIITTYTLGGQGTFRVAIKEKYHKGKTPRGTQFIDYDPVIPGCLKEHERQQLKQRLVSGQITQQQWKDQFVALMQNARGSRKIVLNLRVDHGHIVVMWGKKTQHYLDHCVDVNTPMRFALTFRHVKPEHMSDQLREQLRTRLAYDVEYDDEVPATEQQTLASVGDNPDDIGDVLPAASPRDSPPRQRQRLNSQGDSISIDNSPAGSPSRRGSQRTTSQAVLDTSNDARMGGTPEAQQGQSSSRGRGGSRGARRQPRGGGSNTNSGSDRSTRSRVRKP